MKYSFTHLLSIAAACITLLWMGCDRPFVEQEEPALEVVSPDLSEAFLGTSIMLEIEASSFREIARVTVNGEEATYDAGAGLWQIEVPITNVITRYVITAYDVEDTAGRDTVYAAHLNYSTFVDVHLPVPRGAHTATNLGDGFVLVAGGAEDTQRPALSSALLVHSVDRRVNVLDALLVSARAGHSATTLPDGRTLLLGGAATAAPESVADLISTAEYYDPSTRVFRPMSVDGPPVRRAFHTATTYESNAGTIVAVYGGVGEQAGSQESALGLRADLRRFVVEGDELIALDDATGPFATYGDEVAWHSQTPLSSNRGDLVAGAVDAGNGERPVGFILEQSESGEIQSALAPGLQIDRKQHAAIELRPALVIFAAGRAVPSETILNTLSVYGVESGRYFRIPEQGEIVIKRYAHTATKLSSKRILLVGGFDASGAGISTSILLRPFQE